MNNFKKIADLISFMSAAEISPIKSVYLALHDMSYEYVDSEGETTVLDGDDLFAELPLLVRSADMEIERSIGLEQEEKEVCYEALKAVKKFLYASTKDESWQQVRSDCLKPEIIMSLKLAASAIKASGVNYKIEKEFANKCVEELLSIRDTIIASSITEPLRSHIITNLSELIHIFDTIEVFGLRDAQDKMKVLIADIFLESTSVPKEEQAKLKPLLKTVGKILSKFRNGVGNAKAIEYVAETYDKLL